MHPAPPGETLRAGSAQRHRYDPSTTSCRHAQRASAHPLERGGVCDNGRATTALRGKATAIVHMRPSVSQSPPFNSGRPANSCGATRKRLPAPVRQVRHELFRQPSNELFLPNSVGMATAEVARFGLWTGIALIRTRWYHRVCVYYHRRCGAKKTGRRGACVVCCCLAYPCMHLHRQRTANVAFVACSPAMDAPRIPSALGCGAGQQRAGLSGRRSAQCCAVCTALPLPACLSDP